MTVQRILQSALMGVAALAVIGFVAPQLASADSIVNPGLYLLGDHSDAALFTGDPDTAYGLRVDTMPSGFGATTFSVAEGGAEVLLNWGGTVAAPDATATITGQIRRNGTTELWDVDVTLTGLAPVPLGGDFTGFNATGSTGTISFGTTVVDIPGVANGSGHVFNFLGDGHRLGGMEVVGRGWIINNTDPCCDDWLVTATQVPVPEPATFGLFGVGLAGLALLRRRQNRR